MKAFETRPISIPPGILKILFCRILSLSVLVFFLLSASYVFSMDVAPGKFPSKSEMDKWEEMMQAMQNNDYSNAALIEAYAKELDELCKLGLSAALKCDDESVQEAVEYLKQLLLDVDYIMDELADKARQQAEKLENLGRRAKTLGAENVPKQIELYSKDLLKTKPFIPNDKGNAPYNASNLYMDLSTGKGDMATEMAKEINKKGGGTYASEFQGLEDLIIDTVTKIYKTSKAIDSWDRMRKRSKECLENLRAACPPKGGKYEGPIDLNKDANLWKMAAKSVVDINTGDQLDGATVTFTPKDTSMPPQEGIPDKLEPGDTITVTAKCHQKKTYVIGKDRPPFAVELEKKPLEFTVPCSGDIKELLEDLEKKYGIMVAAEDLEVKELDVSIGERPACLVKIKKYKTKEGGCAGLPRVIDLSEPDPDDYYHEPVLDRHGQEAPDFDKYPNDPFFNSHGSWGQSYEDQWALKRIGFTEADLTGKGTVWPRAGKPIVVAVIDTGVDLFHADLDDRIWRNEDEIPANGVDDDKNGFIDDVHGWNFIDDNANVRDNNGHGTVVAGIIAADVDNAFGIAGVNPFALIMPVKATDFNNSGTSATITQAIVYAVKNGARVINISIGGDGLTRSEQAAVNKAVEAGILVVVAAGNDGKDTKDFSPAGLDGVITVASTDLQDKRVGFSNWGRQVDIAAPGIDVLSLRARGTDLLIHEIDNYKSGTAFVGDDQRYYRVAGSSFSAPFVSGTASLILSVNPELTAAQVRRKILQSATDIEVPGKDQYTGYGLLNVPAALANDPGFFVESRIDGVKVVQEGGKMALRVFGIADADQFGRAWIEIGAGDDPGEWKKVSNRVAETSETGILDDLDVSYFQDSKVWIIRLITEHRNGKKREARFVLRLG